MFRVLLIIALALLPTIAVAQEEEPQCEGSTLDMVQCLRERTAAWDRRLNTAYQERLNAAERRQRDLLRAAQRLWVQFRDANCAYYAAGEGTKSRIEAAECLRRMTESRALELEGEN